MEDQVSLVFRGQLGYLFVETSNRTLQLPSCTLLKCEDFVSAAKRLLNEVSIVWCGHIISINTY